MSQKAEMNFDVPFIEGGKHVGEDGERRAKLWEMHSSRALETTRPLRPKN